MAWCSGPEGSLRWLVILAVLESTFAESLGTCWRLRYSGNHCGRPLRSGVTRGRCCSTRHRRAWSPSPVFGETTPPPDALYLNRTPFALPLHLPWQQNLVTIRREQDVCIPCATSCLGVHCGEDQRCVLQKGVPRCVCSPHCHLQEAQQVCGTDGRSYPSECHLLNRACRKKKSILVAHSGPCQTCNGVRCGKGKTCQLDESLNPRCRRCPPPCTPRPRHRPLCGTDNHTYASRCHMKRASCEAGILILRAYKGACHQTATCDTIRCRRNERCLSDPLTGSPSCRWCADVHKCQPILRPVCASDGQVYGSWCAFRHETCSSGKNLVAKPLSYCSYPPSSSNSKKCWKTSEKKRKWELRMKKKEERKKNRENAEKERERKLQMTISETKHDLQNYEQEVRDTQAKYKTKKKKSRKRRKRKRKDNSMLSWRCIT